MSVPARVDSVTFELQLPHVTISLMICQNHIQYCPILGKFIDTRYRKIRDKVVCLGM